MKRLTVIFLAVVFYLGVISTTLAYLPHVNAPLWLTTLFAKKSAWLVWAKVRHSAVVIIAAALIASFLLKVKKETADSDAWTIGVSATLFGLLQIYLTFKSFNIPFDWRGFSWVEATDFLAILIAIPLAVMAIKLVAKPHTNRRI
ncbi:hypothetical protein [Geomonas edaphica]|uniref:hypothetical protein n=1 Tax=Geomonas edaphica TaxID=2570226 RepID=UPI0010A7733C|nr:hypothetical protein [Geomonas edaphica]